MLMRYVNMPYFGRGQYGIEAASRAYFGKPAKELALHQVAFIVSLINKPALPDRSFATDPLLKTRERNSRCELGGDCTRYPSGARADAGTRRNHRGRAHASGDSRRRPLRKEVLPQGTGCGTHDHFLERVRILYKDRFPISKGGLTISITRDDGLQDVLAKAVDLTLRTYLARHPDDPDNNRYAPELSPSTLRGTCSPRLETSISRSRSTT